LICKLREVMMILELMVKCCGLCLLCKNQQEVRLEMILSVNMEAKYINSKIPEVNRVGRASSLKTSWLILILFLKDPKLEETLNQECHLDPKQKSRKLVLLQQAKFNRLRYHNYPKSMKKRLKRHQWNNPPKMIRKHSI
jgi:hypothetical protein